MNNQRLGYQRLSEALVDRGLVEAQAVQDALSMADHGGLPFPEALVTANLVADWELSHVVSQLYSLPFLTTEMAEPDPEAQKGLDIEFLYENGIVPLSRHGRVLTLCMPAIVPAEILGCIAAESDLLVFVVVGTVNCNRRWIENNTKAKATLGAGGANQEGVGSDWGNLFDEADAAVLQDLDDDMEVDMDMDLDELAAMSSLAESISEQAAETEGKVESVVTGMQQSALPPPLPRTPDADGESVL
ncbi:MAG: hypothetical protein ACI9F9_000237 [Candidatus Paceibacteria bacterium]|jgi:hypothetical protein